MKKKLIFKQIASWSVETEIIIEVELTKKEREENVRLLEEIVEAEFPFDEMADPNFRDKVLTFFVALCLYMKGSKFLSQDRERVMKAWLLSVVDEAGPGDLSDSSSNSSTSLCYISLSLEFGNIAQGGNPL